MPIVLQKPETLMLKARAEKCSDFLDRKDIAKTLEENMKYYQGIGLSANQIGIPERCFVMYSDVKKREVLAVFNPRILSESINKIPIDEGCLTYPGMWLKIWRPDYIEVEYEDVDGIKHENRMYGLECRIFQHEMDHMEGTDFTALVTRPKLDMAKKRASKQLAKAQVELEKMAFYGQP